MPKRSLDIGNSKHDSTKKMLPDYTQRKTERSHEENQERAYIAASRRADRSIEARVQSARMASEIHKKRTGKAFRITEEIVRKEEMYEEEEDDFPRSYRLLGPHMQTASPELNTRVEAYLSNKMAMSAYMARSNDEWRENHINKMFAASFPNAGQQAQQISQTMNQPQQQSAFQAPLTPKSPLSTDFQSINYQQQTGRGSMSAASPADSSHTNGPKMSSTPLAQTSPPATSATTASTVPDFGSAESAFTTELPAEMKMIMTAGGMDPNNMFCHNVYAQQQYTQNSFYPTDGQSKFDDLLQPTEFFEDTVWDDSMVQPMDENYDWDSFINEDWAAVEQ